jgi:hypothetical protein
MAMTKRTANQLYKEQKKKGQTTLSFTAWVEQQKSRNWMRFDGTSEIPIDEAINQEVQSGISNLNAEAGLQTTLNQNYYLGIPVQYIKWGAVAVGVVMVVVIGRIIYKKSRQ